MKVSLILGHPGNTSFCHAIADAAQTVLVGNGHEVMRHDLQAEGFDPRIGGEEARTRVSVDPLVERHCAELAAADGLIVVHPNWWGSPPAIVKGWIDRVIRPGVAYELSSGADGARTLHVGILKVRTALIFNPSDTPEQVEKTKFGNTLDILWKTYIAELCGIRDMQRHVFSVMGTSTPEQRAAWLDQTRALVSRSFPADAP